MKNYFIAPVLFTAILSIIIGFTVTKYYTPTNTIVKITEEGFVPSSVTIQKGDNITWINSEYRPSWPASNSHPSHTEYQTDKKGCINSSLDSCRGLSRNQSFTFNFNKVGVWGMHDHLYPGFTMSVEVLPKIPLFAHMGKKSEQEKIAEIKGIPPEKDFRKLNYAEKHKVMKDLNSKDPKLAWAYLKKASIEDGAVVDDVHIFAHITGNQLFKVHGFDGIKMCSRDFAYGCFHGVTEQMLRDKGIDYLPEIEKKCLELYPHDQGAGIDEQGCIHGVGHGILSWNNLDLPKSLKNCDSLIDEYQTFCFDGVFMELSVSAHKVLDLHDPWKYCMDLDTDFQVHCARYMTDFLLNSIPFDAVEYSKICMTGQSDELRKSCMYHVGYQIAYLYKQEMEEIVKVCKKMPDHVAQNYCLIAAAWEVAFQKYPNWQDVSMSLCSKVTSELRSECGKIE